MGRLLFILILLAWEPELFAQVPMDSVYTFEKEDSLGLLSIKPVRKYKKLVKQIVERLQQDLQQKHGARKYRIDATFRVDTFPSFSASCIFPVAGDNGLEVIDAIENPMERNDMMEDFHYKGSYVLTVQDSTKIKGNLLAFLSFSPAYKEPRFSLSYPTSPFDSYEAIKTWFNVKAYRISYGSNNEVYRIDLVKREKPPRPNRGFRIGWLGEHIVTAFFDCGTLQITRYKAEIRNLGKGFLRSVCSFQADYDEEGGTPVLKQIFFSDATNDVTRKATVRRIN